MGHGSTPTGAEQPAIDFTLNINPFGAPERSIAAGKRAVEHCHRYPAPDLPRLRDALAAWHEIPPASLVFGAGVDELIKLAVHAWLRPGDEAVVPVPTFGRYEVELREQGVAMRAVRGQDPWKIDLDGVRATLAGGEVRAAFLCVPNNPTGATVSAAAVAGLADAFPGVRFVVDEAMIYPSEPGLLPLALSRPNVVALRTFSKYFGLAGLRLGYAVGRPDQIVAIEQARPPFNVSPVASEAAVAALSDTAFLERCRDRMSQEVQHFRSRLAGLRALTIVGAVSNVVMIALDGVATAEVLSTLAARGLLVRDGRSFTGLEDIECIRVSLLDRSANDRLANALHDLCNERGLAGTGDRSLHPAPQGERD